MTVVRGVSFSDFDDDGLSKYGHSLESPHQQTLTGWSMGATSPTLTNKAAQKEHARKKATVEMLGPYAQVLQAGEPHEINSVLDTIQQNAHLVPVPMDLLRQLTAAQVTHLAYTAAKELERQSVVASRDANNRASNRASLRPGEIDEAWYEKGGKSKSTVQGILKRAASPTRSMVTPRS